MRGSDTSTSRVHATGSVGIHQCAVTLSTADTGIPGAEGPGHARTSYPASCSHPPKRALRCSSCSTRRIGAGAVALITSLRRGAATLWGADRDAPRSRPSAVVLYMGERDRRVLAGQRIITGGIALEAEVVEAALLAVHVQLLGEVRALAPRTAPLALAGPDVPTAPAALLKLHPVAQASLLGAPLGGDMRTKEGQKDPLQQGRRPPTQPF